jgi:hypothetical protein
VIVEMQHGAQLGKRSSNPIQKVVNPVGTVITVSFPSEDWDTSQTSDFNVTVPRNCKSSAEEEGGVKPVLYRFIRNNPPSLNDTVRWPAVPKPECFSKSKGYDPSKCGNKEAEIRTQSKGKNNSQSVSGKQYSNKLQDEGKDVNKWPVEEDKKEHNVTARKIESGEIMVPWRSHRLVSGPFAFSASVQEKDCEKTRTDKIESDCKYRKFLPSKTSDTGVEVVNEIHEKETEVKMTKSKTQISLEVKDGSNTSYKPKSCIPKSTITNEPSFRGNFKMQKGPKPGEGIFCESTFRLDEMKVSEIKSFKQNTQKKATCVTSTPDKNIKKCVEDKAHVSLDGGQEDDKIPVSKLMLMDVVSMSGSLDGEDNKEITQGLYDYDSLCTTGDHDIKKSSKRSKASECLLLEGNDLVGVSYSRDVRSASGKLDTSLVSAPKIEPLKLCSSLLHERCNEHHFGTERNALHEAVRNSDFESPQKSEEETWSSQVMEMIVEKKTKNMTREVSEKKSYRGNTDLEADSDQGSQENLVFRSTLDDIFAPPQLSWSSIVSSSNRSTSPLRETVSPAISETVLLKLEELKICPQQSWSDIAKGSPDQAQIETASDTNNCQGFESGKGAEDVDDYSDEGEGKVTMDSSKSQSSDRTSCSEMVTASESVSTVATSESSGATAGNDEDCSQLNEENNGNDDELADNREATSITALQGTNKKTRRAKKKRR